VRVVSVTHVVVKSDEATLVARVAPADAHCNLVICLRSGPSAASGLGPKRAEDREDLVPRRLTRGPAQAVER